MLGNQRADEPFSREKIAVVGGKPVNLGKATMVEKLISDP